MLTEALHLLRPGSPGPPRLMGYIRNGGLALLPVDDKILRRCFDLMIQYADLPMDLADASLVAAAEHARTDKVFTLDRRDFTAYRITRGYHTIPFTIIGDPSGLNLFGKASRERLWWVSTASYPPLTLT